MASDREWAIAEAIEPAMVHIEEADEEYRLALARIVLRTLAELEEGKQKHG